MKQPDPLLGYLYGDVTADGATLASAADGSHVLFNRERIDVPAQYGGLLRPRLRHDGGNFGGEPQNGFQCLAYDGGAWTQLPGRPIGPNSFIFGAAGAPLVAIAGEHTPTGTGGYWYIDDAGQPVPTDRVYVPNANAPALSQHTFRGDLAIGQGNPGGGILVWWQGKHRQIAEGEIEFIRVPKLKGDVIRLAYSMLKVPSVSFLALTMAELAAWPVYTFPVSVPVPAPVPTPTPVPAPTPTPAPSGGSMRYPDTMIDYVNRRWRELDAFGRCQAIWNTLSQADQDAYRRSGSLPPGLRQKFGHIATEALLRAVAEFTLQHNPHRFDIRIYTKPKTDSTFALTMDDGSIRHAAEDIIGVIDGDQRGWADVGGGFGGPEPTLRWPGNLNVEPHNDDRYVVPPKSLLGSNHVPPPPPPPPPSQELASAKRRISELEAEVRALKARPVATGGSYDEMMAMKDRALEAYAAGSLGQAQADQTEQAGLGRFAHVMPSATVWHLAFRYLREGFTGDQVVEDARQRGDGQVPA